MPGSLRTEEIVAGDGGRFPAVVVLPEHEVGPGLLLLPEIFGLNDYVRDRARRLAALGYVVLAPDLYWRLGPGIEIDEREEGSLERAFGYRQRLDFEAAVDDSVAALEHLRGLAKGELRTGVMGYCLGGGLAFQVASRADADTAVCYYPSGIGEMLELAPRVRCPILFHFGDADTFLPPEEAAAVRQAFAAHPDAAFHSHAGAGHAFDNDRAAAFSNPEAAAEAWPQTVDFLSRTLPAGR
jgi:carboxymethylenebutenolidase